MRVRGLIAALTVVAFAFTVGSGAAGAAVPGANGKLALALDNDIYVVEADGTGLALLADTGGYDGDPAWAPDGSRLAFSGDGDLWVVDADGSGLERITRGPQDDASPDWSPDGKKIVFQRGQSLFVIDPDGRRLTALGFGGLWPAWSPNGARLAYESANGLAVSRVDGSARRLLVRGEDSYLHPDWSPDGERVVFTFWATFDGDLYTVGADGEGLARLADQGSAEAASPTR